MLTNFLISHLQLVPTLKPTPAPVEPDPTPAPVPVPESTITAPEPDNLTPDETQPPVQSPDSAQAPATDDNFSALYPGAPSSAYIHSSSVTALIAVGSAMVWTLAVFM